LVSSNAGQLEVVPADRSALERYRPPRRKPVQVPPPAAAPDWLAPPPASGSRKRTHLEPRPALATAFPELPSPLRAVTQLEATAPAPGADARPPGCSPRGAPPPGAPAGRGAHPRPHTGGAGGRDPAGLGARPPRGHPRPRRATAAPGCPAPCGGPALPGSPSA